MIHLLGITLTGLVLVEHVFFLVLEMFLWNTPTGRKAFGLTSDFAQSSATLAKNQGLYNGFLAAGLLWSFLHSDPEVTYQLRLFFLGCVVVAGIFGAWTVKPKIFFLQALPAGLAVLFLWMARQPS